MANANRVTFPLTAPGITINSLNYQPGVGRPTAVNNSLFYFTNTETTPADSRFPTHIPRPGRYAMEDYSAVQFALGQPAEQFGVFVAMNSHFAPGQPPYDDNNVLMYPSRKLWVAVLGEGDTFATAQMQQISVGNLYAPFIQVTASAGNRIKSVCVVQDAEVEYNAPFGFFDPYSVTPEPVTGLLMAAGAMVIGAWRRLRGAPCKGVGLQWVQHPPGNWSLQPVAIGAAVEETKPSKPLMQGSLKATWRACRP